MNINKIKVRRIKDTYWNRITPEMAEELLKLNAEDNRNLSMTRVKRYAEDMRCGRWNKNNLDPIGCILDQRGNIAQIKNGQHRLNAIVMSGVPAFCEFAEMTEKDFQYIDQGKNRKTIDFVHEKNAKCITALATRILRTKKYNVPLSRIATLSQNTSMDVEITQQRVLDYIHECEADIPEWQECVAKAQRIRKGIFNKGSLAGCVYFCWLVKWLGLDDHLDEYIDDITSELSESIAVRLFKNYYQTMMVSGVVVPEFSLLKHLLWTYDHFYSCRYKKYPATKIDAITDKYEDLIAKRKGGAKNG